MQLASGVLALVVVAGTARGSGEYLVLTRFQGNTTLVQRVADAVTAEVAARLDRPDLPARTAPLDVVALREACRAKVPWGTPEHCGLEDGALLQGSLPDDFRSGWVLVGTLTGVREPRRGEVTLVRLPGGEVLWRDGTLAPGAPAFAAEVGAAVEGVLASHGLAARPGDPVTAFVATAPPPAPAPPSRTPAWVAVGLGGAAALAGAGSFVAAGVMRGELASASWKAGHDVTQVASYTQAYNRTIVAADVLTASGAALAAFGVVWALTIPASPPPVSVAPAAGGVVVGGAW